MPGYEDRLGIIRWALRGTKGFTMVRCQPFVEAMGAVGPVRHLDAEVRRDSKGASVKKFVIHPIPTRPSFLGKDLTGRPHLHNVNF